jgi:hypothetical protein
MTAVRSFLLLALLVSSAVILAPRVGATPARSPGPSGSATQDGFGVSATTRSRHDEETLDGTDPRQIACLKNTGPGTATVTAGDPCGIADRVCVAATGTTLVTQQVSGPNGTVQTIGVDCLAAAPPKQDANLVVAAHEEFSRRVPVVVIKAAPGSGQTLVNVEVLFWLDTGSQVDLGSAVLLGQSVQLLASVESVRWAFGDGSAVTGAGAGRPFLASDFCDTKQCPGWFGHTYTQTSKSVTITANATWAGRYSVNGGPFQLITGTVTAAPTTIAMQVVQSRTVLIPNPTSTQPK